MGLQVEIFNPVLNIETKNINETSNEYSVALGLGMHNIFPVFPINVNLLLEEIIYKRIQAKQKKNVVLLVIFLVLALLEYSVKFYFELKQKEKELRYLEEEYRAQRIPSGEPGVNFSYEQIINEVNKAKEKKANFEKIKGIIENIQNEKARWLDVLAELSELLNNKFDGIYTGNIWIDRINFQEKKSITIVGYTKTYNMITNFIRALNKSKHFSVPENERPQQQEKVIDGETFIEFTLKADVKHYIESAKTEEEKNEVKKEESPKQPAAAAQEEKETKKTDNSEDDSEAEEE